MRLVVLAYVGVSIVLTIVYFALPTGLARDVVVYPLFGFGAAAAIAVGIFRYRPRDPLPWLLIAASCFLFAVGDLLFGVYEQILHRAPFPSVADFFYLAAYPVIAAGILLLVRLRSGGRDYGSLVDAAIITVAVGVPAWVFLMAPYIGNEALSVAEKVTVVAYPAGDVLLLAVAARLVLGSGARTVAYWLVALGVFVGLCADLAYLSVQ